MNERIRPELLELDALRVRGKAVTTEAPVDGKYYARRNAGWSDIARTFARKDEVVGEPGPQGRQGEQGQTGPSGPAGPVGPQGDAGPQGDPGPQGERGAQGLPGADGADGEDGSRWFSGKGKPAAELGEPGDWYLDATTGDFFAKTDTGWERRGNLKGPKGDRGPQGDRGLQGFAGGGGGPGPPGAGVPVGGSAGQVLTKIDGADYNTEWSDPTGGSGGGADEVWIGPDDPGGTYELWYDPDADGIAASPRDLDAVVTLIDGAAVALDAALGDTFSLLAAGDRTIGVPTNKPAAGQSQNIIIMHEASGGNRTLSLATGSAGAFRFGTDIPGLTTTTNGLVDYISAKYNAAGDRWDVVNYAKGYGTPVAVTAASLVFQGTATYSGSVSGGAAYTFTLTVASAAGQERLIAVAGIGSPVAYADFVSLTCDGQTATRIGTVSKGADDGGNTCAFVTFYRAPGTSGTSINVVATTDLFGGAFGAYCAVWTLNDAGSVLATTNSAVTDPTLDINTVSGGAVAAATLAYNGPPLAAWTGLTEKFDVISLFGGDNFTGASADIASGSTPLAINAALTPDATLSCAAICVSFNPVP